jgi:nicotinate-nucleotide adenylyltransferase
MRKVGLIFGSFNPIHNAHIGIGELAIDSGFVDEVWFVIAKQNPFKDNYGVDFDDRERMIGIALMETHLRGYKMKSVSVEKFLLDDKPKTYNTLNAIKIENSYQEVDYTIICGDDMYNQIPNWYNGQQLLDEYKFIVFGRDNDTPIVCENVKYLNTNGLEDISSTKIREMIKNDDDNVLNYINEYVLKYIKDFNIYK